MASSIRPLGDAGRVYVSARGSSALPLPLLPRARAAAPRPRSSSQQQSPRRSRFVAPARQTLPPPAAAPTSEAAAAAEPEASKELVSRPGARRSLPWAGGRLSSPLRACVPEATSLPFSLNTPPQNTTHTPNLKTPPPPPPLPGPLRRRPRPQGVQRPLGLPLGRLPGGARRDRQKRGLARGVRKGLRAPRLHARGRRDRLPRVGARGAGGGAHRRLQRVAAGVDD